MRASPFRLALACAALLAACAAPSAHAQEADTTAARANPYGSGLGFEILLTNNGFGLGAYALRAVSPSTSLYLELSLGSGKDEREFKFQSYWGRSIIQNKANYLLMVPVQAGIVRRLFEDHIEENFRPYVQASGGPTFGWEYPYFRDCNGDGVYDPEQVCRVGGDDPSFERTYDVFAAFPRGHLQMGVGGTLALGAHFGLSRRVTQGIRLGYTFTYFFDEIELLEPGIQGGAQRYFGSPSISITFGRLY